MEEMNMKENSRMIIALRAVGWTDKQINDLVLYIETGEENHLEILKEEIPKTK